MPSYGSEFRKDTHKVLFMWVGGVLEVVLPGRATNNLDKGLLGRTWGQEETMTSLCLSSGTWKKLFNTLVKFPRPIWKKPIPILLAIPPLKLQINASTFVASITYLRIFKNFRACNFPENGPHRRWFPYDFSFLPNTYDLTLYQTPIIGCF